MAMNGVLELIDLHIYLLERSKDIFRPYKFKWLISLLEVILDTTYAFLIHNHITYTWGNTLRLLYSYLCFILAFVRGLKAHSEYKGIRKLEEKVEGIMTRFTFEDGKEEDCGICLEKMKAAWKLKCGHHFHRECLVQMILNDKDKCPICRCDVYLGPAAANNQKEENKCDSVTPTGEDDGKKDMKEKNN
eukprot:TRINITY_DN8607_c0_g1_i3.p1 TRINITY_DN8607_c0_g1~~TRINITY_DN8607_c0_g1_i3.p1  ORF type:complete len:189 (+),score=48.82 TRINITY_DN8607_c0_g1_i3:815-1381(+)